MSSAPCLTKSGLTVRLIVLPQYAHAVDRSVSLPLAHKARLSAPVSYAKPMVDAGTRPYSNCPTPSMPPETTDPAADVDCPADSSASNEIQLMSAFSALLDCSNGRRCFDGRCKTCRESIELSCRNAESTKEMTLSQDTQHDLPDHEECQDPFELRESSSASSSQSASFRMDWS